MLEDGSDEYWITSSASVGGGGNGFWGRIGTVGGRTGDSWIYEFIQVTKAASGYGTGNTWVDWESVPGGILGLCYNGMEAMSGVYSQLQQGCIVWIEEIDGEYWCSVPVLPSSSALYAKVNSYTASGHRWLYNCVFATHSTATSSTGPSGWTASASGITVYNLAETVDPGYTYAPIPSGTVMEVTRTVVGSGYDYYANMPINTGVQINCATTIVSGTSGWALSGATASGFVRYHAIDYRWNTSTYHWEKLMCADRYDPYGRLISITPDAYWTDVTASAVCSGAT